ncbi:large-conductance mechanosensitive channel [Lentzea sp. NBRC 105346]|uniref:large-conductance mechanosensitive channel protein MscL n=1 Tax=Lentzea sp. NBRC 105346 TaxID=3032205 RepID=UPI0024A4D667|nr:large-conductance mechanosensitive channel protein MscL [Lentzea sp. NBRC 105346]GLZ34465.1 large-conductance mechanosensitive channel [Lentzea sp. NBRC 105346]
MLKGFKDFLMRGNVVDLAVAVVIGTAFTAIVTAFTGSIIKPLLNAFGGTETKGLGFNIIPSKDATYVDISGLLNAIINFVIIAAVVYFVLVLPLQKIQERRKRGEEPGPKEPTDVEVLKEIRDLLAAQQKSER